MRHGAKQLRVGAVMPLDKDLGQNWETDYYHFGYRTNGRMAKKLIQSTERAPLV